MQARRCQGCGAALPESVPGEAVRCPFCGLLHDAAAQQPFVHVQEIRIGQVPAATVTRRSGFLLAVILVVVLVPVLVGGFIAWKVTGAVGVVGPSVASVATSVIPRTPDQLSGIEAGYHALDVAPPSGGYGAIDPVTAVPWALAVAQGWERDARLTRIDLARLRPDGTVNVRDDPDARLRYRFISPARTAALVEQARLRGDARAITGVWVQVERGEPRVFGEEATAATVSRDAAPPHPGALPLAELMARPAVRAVRPPVPFLDGYLVHLEDDGWTWYFSTLARESLPRVRAADGAVWPYDRRSRTR